MSYRRFRSFNSFVRYGVNGSVLNCMNLGLVNGVSFVFSNSCMGIVSISLISPGTAGVGTFLTGGCVCDSRSSRRSDGVCCSARKGVDVRCLVDSGGVECEDLWCTV